MKNLCWKQSKQIGKRIPREAFLLSICLRSFFPHSPTRSIMRQKDKFGEKRGRDRCLKRGCKTRLCFSLFFFFFSIMLFFTRKNHRRPDSWKKLKRYHSMIKRSFSNQSFYYFAISPLSKNGEAKRFRDSR